MRIRWIVLSSLHLFFLDRTNGEFTKRQFSEPTLNFTTPVSSTSENFNDIIQQGLAFDKLDNGNETSLDRANETVSRFFVDSTNKTTNFGEETTTIRDNGTQVPSTESRGLLDNIERNFTRRNIKFEKSENSADIGEHLSGAGNDTSTGSGANPRVNNRTPSLVRPQEIRKNFTFDKTTNEKIYDSTERIMSAEVLNIARNISSLSRSAKPRIFDAEGGTSAKNHGVSRASKNTPGISSDREALENNEAKKDNETRAVFRMMEDENNTTMNEVESIIDRVKNLTHESRKIFTRRFDSLNGKSSNGRGIVNEESARCRCCRRRCGCEKKGRKNSATGARKDEADIRDFGRPLANNVRPTLVPESGELAAIYTRQKTALPAPTSTTTVEPTTSSTPATTEATTTTTTEATTAATASAALETKKTRASMGKLRKRRPCACRRRMSARTIERKDHRNGRRRKMRRESAYLEEEDDAYDYRRAQV